MSLEHEVGITAGEIYKKFAGLEHYAPMNRVVKVINRDPRIIALALGWLLREKKIEARRDGGKLLIKVLSG